MKIIKRNILDTTEGLIAHQVNLKGVMGAGLALQIRRKYPAVYNNYLLACSRRSLNIGDAQIIQVSDRLWVANLAAQQNYGREKGKCYTDYDALRLALKRLKMWQQCTNQPVYLPYGIGCGLAGGEWELVEGFIAGILPNAILVRL